MRIHDCGWRKFVFRKGHGLFVELMLFCQCCDGRNTTQTTGYEIGKDRTIEDVVQKIVQEIKSGEYRCEGCGIASMIAPEKHLDHELDYLTDELSAQFFDSLPVSPAPSEIQGICIN